MDIHIEPEIWIHLKVFGFEIPISDAVCVTWIVMIMLIILGMYVRFVALPKFTDTPEGFQNIVELFVEAINNFTQSKTEGQGEGIAPYIGTLAIYLILANTIELVGLRPPTTNISTTLALAVITFMLINYYGVRKHGVWGRIKALGKPFILLAPVNIMTELALPISMASRLFGNILAGLIVMEMVYKVMGNFGLFIPAILAIYFNVFDGLMQTFIFITLTLTFIGEKLED
jgi:F-type H+-transporting ATPase subunit a